MPSGQSDAAESGSNSDNYQELAFEDLSQVKKKIKLKISASELKKQFESELQSVSQRASFKGFRPGKVPRAMVEKLHGGSVRVQVVDKLINSTIKDLSAKKSLDVINVTDVDLDPGVWTNPKFADADLEFSAVLVLYPKPEIKDYKGHKVSVTKSKTGEKEVDDVITRMRNARAQVKTVEGREKVQDGDIINGEVQINVDGEPETRPEPIAIEMSDPALPQEVRTQISDMKIGETREIPVTFPEDYKDENLKGKKAKYCLKINALSSKVLPELDDDFAKSCNAGAENVAQLKEKISESLSKELEQKSKNDSEVEIIKIILEKNQFDVPEILVDDEIRNMALRSGVIDPNQYDASKIPVEALRPGLGEAATQRVKASIAVDRIAEIENLRANKEEMDAKITQLSTELGIAEEEIRKFVFQDGRGVNMLMDITRSKVMDFLIKENNVTYVEA